MFVKYWKKVVSLLLVLALILQISPLTVYAEDALPEVLTCSPQSGLSTLYEHTPYEAGKAGTAYVNTYLGTLHLRRSDLTLGGERMPVSIDFYYDGVNSDADNPYGAGWTTAYNQLLSYDQESEKYTYKNENGTWICFVNSGESDETGREIWVEDISYGVGEVGVTLYLPADAAETDYTAADLVCADVHYTFDGSGRLTRFSCGSNQTIISYLAGSNHAIECITDSVGRKFCFAYVNGYLASVCAKTAADEIISNTTVTYTVSNGLLTAATYSSNDTASYGYDEVGRLIRLVNVDGCGYVFTYSDDTEIISTITAKAAMGTEQEASGTQTTFSRPTEQSVTVTEEGTQYAYTFDGCGRVTNCELRTPMANSVEFRCLYGYNLTYGYVTDESGRILHQVTDMEAYDSDGVIQDETEQPEETEPEDQEEPEATEATEAVEEEIDDYTYITDSYGNITSETYTQDGVNQVSTYTYSADGNYLVSQTDADGGTVQYQYDLNSGLLQSLTDANNHTTQYTYNALRELSAAHLDVSGLVNGTGMDVSYTYSSGRLTQLQYGSYQYGFTYDIWGNVLTVTMNGSALVSYDYGAQAHKGAVQTLTYGNGQQVNYAYNALGQVTSVGYTNQPSRFAYTYNSDGTLSQIYDSILQETTVYTDTGFELRDANNAVIYSQSNAEDGTVTEVVDGTVFITTNPPGKTITTETGAQIAAFSRSYDAFERITGRIAAIGDIQIKCNYTYNTPGDGRTGTHVSELTVQHGSFATDKTHYEHNYSFHYTYDGSGNITGVTETYTKTEEAGDVPSFMSLEFTPLPGAQPEISTEAYTYDEAGQLIEAAYGGQLGTNNRYVYTYDASGNLCTAKTYTMGFTGEQLTDDRSYQYTNGIRTGSTVNGVSTTYQVDSMGNPTRITTGSTTKTLTWGEGRMLTSIAQDAANYVNYTYNADGLRTTKTVSEWGHGSQSTQTSYIWDGNRLVATKVTSAMMSDTVVVLYDADGSPAGFTCNGTPYSYIKNLQGDVLRILDEDGDTVVTYSYDPWGVPTITGNTALAAINPCSYRGYDYDEETGYYYLQSRYYDPTIGRFINADDIFFLGMNNTVQGNNLFAYCDNSPTNYSDPTGYLKLGRHSWNKTSFVAKTIDILIIAIPALYTLSKVLRAGSIAAALAKTASTMSRKALRDAFVKMGLKLAQATGWAALANLGGAVYNIISTIFGKTLGDMIAGAIDKLDGRKDGYIYA